jgi:hypothetical protein
MTGSVTVSGWLSSARRFTTAICDSESGWPDEVGSRIRREHCVPITHAAEELARELEELSRAIGKIERSLR